MYAAKRGGKNRVVYFSPQLATTARERLESSRTNYAAPFLAVKSTCITKLSLKFRPSAWFDSRRWLAGLILPLWGHPTCEIHPDRRRQRSHQSRSVPIFLSKPAPKRSSGRRFRQSRCR